MKIKGPGGPTAPPDTTETEKAGKPKAAGATFAEKLGETARPGGPGGPGGPAADAVRAVAAELEAGKLTPKQAVDKLMDLAVADGPAAKLPRKVQDKLRGELEDLLRSDPYLAGKVRRVGVPGGDDE